MALLSSPGPFKPKKGPNTRGLRNVDSIFNVSALKWTRRTRAYPRIARRAPGAVDPPSEGRDSPRTGEQPLCVAVKIAKD